MPIRTVVTEGFGSFGTIPLVVTMGYSIGEATPEPGEVTVTAAGVTGRVAGGGWAPRPGVSIARDEQAVDEIRALYRRIYEERQDLPEEEIREAAASVAKYVDDSKDDGKALPPVDSIDFDALGENRVAVLALRERLEDLIRGLEIGLAKRMAVEREDEEIMILLMSAH